MAANKFSSATLSPSEIKAMLSASGKHRAREVMRLSAAENGDDRLSATMSSMLSSSTAAENREAERRLRAQAPRIKKWLQEYRPVQQRVERRHNPIRTPPFDFEWWTWRHRGAGLLDRRWGPYRDYGSMGSNIVAPLPGSVNISMAVAFWIVAHVSGTLTVRANYTIAGRSLCYAAGVGWASTSTQFIAKAELAGDPSNEFHANDNVVDIWGAALARFIRTPNNSRSIMVSRPVRANTRYNIWLDLYQKVNAFGVGYAGSNNYANVSSVEWGIMP